MILQHNNVLMPILTEYTLCIKHKNNMCDKINKCG